MARKTIHLKGPVEINEDGVAGSAITPGMLVSGVSTINPHVTAAATAVARTFALERDELGLDMDDDYAVGDQVKVGSFPPGSRVYAWLTTSQTIAEGDFLKSAGATGYVQAHGGTNVAILRALEAVTTTAAAARIRCEVV